MDRTFTKTELEVLHKIDLMQEDPSRRTYGKLLDSTPVCKIELTDQDLVDLGKQLTTGFFSKLRGSHKDTEALKRKALILLNKARYSQTTQKVERVAERDGPAKPHTTVVMPSGETVSRIERQYAAHQFRDALRGKPKGHWLPQLLKQEDPHLLKQYKKFSHAELLKQPKIQNLLNNWNSLAKAQHMKPDAVIALLKKIFPEATILTNSPLDQAKSSILIEAIQLDQAIPSTLPWTADQRATTAVALAEKMLSAADIMEPFLKSPQDQQAYQGMLRHKLTRDLLAPPADTDHQKAHDNLLARLDLHEKEEFLAQMKSLSKEVGRVGEGFLCWVDRNPKTRSRDKTLEFLKIQRAFSELAKLAGPSTLKAFDETIHTYLEKRKDQSLVTPQDLVAINQAAMKKLFALQVAYLRGLSQEARTAYLSKLEREHSAVLTEALKKPPPVPAAFRAKAADTTAASTVALRKELMQQLSTAIAEDHMQDAERIFLQLTAEERTQLMKQALAQKNDALTRFLALKGVPIPTGLSKEEAARLRGVVQALLQTRPAPAAVDARYNFEHTETEVLINTLWAVGMLPTTEYRRKVAAEATRLYDVSRTDTALTATQWATLAKARVLLGTEASDKEKNLEIVCRLILATSSDRSLEVSRLVDLAGRSQVEALLRYRPLLKGPSDVNRRTHFSALQKLQVEWTTPFVFAPDVPIAKNDQQLKEQVDSLIGQSKDMASTDALAKTCAVCVYLLQHEAYTHRNHKLRFFNVFLPGNFKKVAAYAQTLPEDNPLRILFIDLEKLVASRLKEMSQKQQAVPKNTSLHPSRITQATYISSLNRMKADLFQEQAPVKPLVKASPLKPLPPSLAAPADPDASSVDRRAMEFACITFSAEDNLAQYMDLEAVAEGEAQKVSLAMILDMAKKGELERSGFGSSFADGGVSLLRDYVFPAIIAEKREVLERQKAAGTLPRAKVEEALNHAATAEEIISALRLRSSDPTQADSEVPAQQQAQLLMQLIPYMGVQLGGGAVKTTTETGSQVDILQKCWVAVQKKKPVVVNALAGSGKSTIVKLFAALFPIKKEVPFIIHVAPFAQQEAGWTPCRSKEEFLTLIGAKSLIPPVQISMTAETLGAILKAPTDFTADQSKALQASLFMLDEYDDPIYRKEGVHTQLEALQCQRRVNISATGNAASLGNKITHLRAKRDEYIKLLAGAPRESTTQALIAKKLEGYTARLKELEGYQESIQRSIAEELEERDLGMQLLKKNQDPLPLIATEITGQLKKTADGDSSFLVEFPGTTLRSATDATFKPLEDAISSTAGVPTTALLFRAPNDQGAGVLWAKVFDPKAQKWTLMTLEDYEKAYGSQKPKPKTICLYTSDSVGGDFQDYSHLKTIGKHHQYVVLPSVPTTSQLYQFLRRLRRAETDKPGALPAAKIYLPMAVQEQCGIGSSASSATAKQKLMEAAQTETTRVELQAEQTRLHTKLAKKLSHYLRMEVEITIEEWAQKWATSAGVKTDDPRVQKAVQQLKASLRDKVATEQATLAQQFTDGTPLKESELTTWLETRLTTLKTELASSVAKVQADIATNPSLVARARLLRILSDKYFKPTIGLATSRGMDARDYRDAVSALADKIYAKARSNFNENWLAFLQEEYQAKGFTSTDITPEVAQALLSDLRKPPAAVSQYGPQYSSAALLQIQSQSIGSPMQAAQILVASQSLYPDALVLAGATQNASTRVKGGGLIASRRPWVAQRLEEARQGGLLRKNLQTSLQGALKAQTPLKTGWPVDAMRVRVQSYVKQLGGVQRRLEEMENAEG